MITTSRKPSHPGAALKAMVVDARHIQITDLAQAIDISRKTLSQILNGKARLTPLVASKLARALNITATPWVQMQTAYDLYEAEETLKQWHPEKQWPPEPTFE